VNVLFTSAGRRVELVRSFRRALDELELDGRLVGVDIDPLAAALRVMDASRMVPPFDSPDYVPALLDICRTEDIDLLVPLIDKEMSTLVEHIDDFERVGVRPLVLGPATFPFTEDKLETYRFFVDLGVPTPATWTPDEARDADLEYPLFIKPRRGSSGKDAYMVRNQREFDFFSDYIDEPLVQAYVDGPEITSDVLCDGSGSVRSVVSRRRIEVRAGEVSKGVTVVDDEVIERCVQIAQGLKATCPITVQCILRDGVPQFIEINPRFGGGVPLAIEAGAPLPKWLLAIESGIPISIPPLGSYRSGVFFTRFDEAFSFGEESLGGT
jgi:carbamoyl-phosphate synthase large subunit